MIRRQTSLGCLPNLGRWLRLEHREHLPGKDLQAALGHLVGHAAKAEGDVEFEIADDLPPLFETAQDPVRRSPTRGLHEPSDGALDAALARDLSLLLIGVIALQRPEVLTEELVMVEIALDKFTLILACFFFGFCEIGAAHAELGHHYLGRLGAVVLAV